MIKVVKRLVYSGFANRVCYSGMGLSEKEACETLKSSMEAIENAQTVERYTWFGSAEHIKLRTESIIKKQTGRAMTKDWSGNIILKETKYK